MRKSTTSWCVFLGDALMSWNCKKQDCISKSFTETEYRAISSACSEIVWLNGLLADLGFAKFSATSLHANNLVRFTSQLIQGFINEPSILRLIVIIFRMQLSRS